MRALEPGLEGLVVWSARARPVGVAKRHEGSDAACVAPVDDGDQQPELFMTQHVVRYECGLRAQEDELRLSSGERVGVG